MATGKERFAELLSKQDYPMITSFQQTYIDALKQYYFVGGMPEAVQSFAENKDFNEVREIQMYYPPLISLQSVLQARQRQEFFIRLNTLCQKLTVPEQGIGRDRCRYILRRFFVSDMDGLERNTVFLCCFLYPWYPIIGVGTLVGVVEDESTLLHPRVSRAVLESRHLCIICKRQIHEINPAVGYVRHTEPLISKEFRIRQKFPLPALRAQNTNTFLSLRPGITDTRLQQIIRISVSLHGAGYP